MAIESTRVPAYAFTRSQKVAAAVAFAVVALVFQETLAFLWATWQREEYSHCFLIPLLSAFLLWQRWPQIRHRQFRIMGAGLLVVMTGFAGFFLASSATNGSLEAYALIVVIVGCLLTLMGWHAFKLAAGPVALLLLAVPLPAPFHDALSSELQLLSSQLGAGILRLLDISVFLDGTVIDFGTQKLQLQAISNGLNYVLPLLTLGTIMAFFVRGQLWVRVFIVLSTIPIAILMNGVRIGILGLQISHAGNSLQFLHLFEGWAIFMACVMLLVGEVWLLLKLSGDQRRLGEALAIDWSGAAYPAGLVSGEKGSRPTPHARVLVVTGNFAPEITGIGKYVGEMTAWMSQAGFEIRVITAPPYYPAWRVTQGYSSRRYALERHSGALVYRCPLLVPRRPRGVTRLLHTFSFAISTLPVILWQTLIWRPQLVFVVEPPLTCAPAAVLGAWLCGARSWLHVQDYEVDAAFELGLLRNEQMRRFAVRVERWLMRRFDMVSSISPRMLRKLLRKGVERSRVGYFPNWVDTTLIKPTARENSLRKELGIPAEIAVLLYSGNMGEKQGLELLVQTAKIFAATEERVLFLLCGDGAAKGRIMVAAEGLANVRFLPLQPLSRLNELLGLADVHMLPQRMGAEDLVMPSKLTAIMASGRPVVASARMGSDLARAASPGGLIAAPGDPLAFAFALKRLLGDENLRTELGRSGRHHAVANWDRETILRNAERELHAMLGDNESNQEKILAPSMVRLQ